MPAAAGKMPLVNEDIQISDNGGNTAKCDYARYGKKGQFRSGVYLQLAWIEADSPAEPWSDLDVWCGASAFDPTCTNSCFTYPRHGERQLYVSWFASGPDEWDPRPIVERTAEELAAAFEQRAALCPAGFKPQATAPIVTTIVLSGGKKDEPPVIGATVPMPEDDQHRIVIGGLNGEVIREEHLGDQATIVGYGPIVTDADGNWSVSVEVEASIAPEAEPASGAEPEVDADAAPGTEPQADAGADAEAQVQADAAPGTEPQANAGAEAQTDVDAEADAAPETGDGPAADAAPETEPESSPTPVPPPEMIGIPDAVADYVAGLEPEAAGAVRDITDHIAALGDKIVQEGVGEVTIPASDLASLRLLVPGMVDEIRLVPGGIIVDSIIDVRVTPVIGDDGLVEFRTNRLQGTIRSHEIVEALVLALNNYVDQSGGRFSTISVTPNGLTVTAERVPQE